MSRADVRRVWRTAFKTPWLTLLVVLTLSFGLAVWLAAASVVSAFEADPLREATALYRVEIIRHRWLQEALSGTDMVFVSELPQLALADAEVALLSHGPGVTRQTAVTAGELPVFPEGQAPSFEPVRLLERDGFSMFDLRFASGRPFDAAPDTREVVLSSDAARAWFGDADRALGRHLKASGVVWTIVGVLAPSAATGRRLHFLEKTRDPSVWLPFAAAGTLGFTASLRHLAPAADGGALHASLWVMLPDSAAREHYLRFAQQVVAGRGPAEAQVRLRSYREWSGVLGAPAPFRIFQGMALVMLVACGVSLSRLLHSRFRLRGPEMAVQRALGATRAHVLQVLLTEAGLIGAVGSVLGVVLSLGMLAILVRVIPDETPALHLTAAGMLRGAVTGLGVSLAAALLPAWRLVREPVAVALRRA